MDDNLREMGVGDQSVPKRMQAFGEAFYGRTAAYDMALSEGSEAFAAALCKNVLDGADMEKARTACGLRGGRNGATSRRSMTPRCLAAPGGFPSPKQARAQ